MFGNGKSGTRKSIFYNVNECDFNESNGNGKSAFNKNSISNDQNYFLSCINFKLFYRLYALSQSEISNSLSRIAPSIKLIL